MSYLYCPAEAIDAVTGQCSDPHWVDSPGGAFPPLTAGEGVQIGFAIVGCWALGLCGRLLFKTMRGYL